MNSYFYTSTTQKCNQLLWIFLWSSYNSLPLPEIAAWHKLLPIPWTMAINQFYVSFNHFHFKQSVGPVKIPRKMNACRREDHIYLHVLWLLTNKHIKWATFNLIKYLSLERAMLWFMPHPTSFLLGLRAWNISNEMIGNAVFGHHATL